MYKAESEKVLLSVIMPVRNEEAHLGNVLLQLSGQTLPSEHYEILVVDGCSEDRTTSIAESMSDRFPNFQILKNTNYLSGPARNLGVRHARGDFVLFLDGHCQIQNLDMLEKALKAFQEGNTCLSRPQPQITAGVSPLQKAVALCRGSILGHYIGSRIYRSGDYYCNPISAGCAYSKELFLSFGGFDESFDACEDLEFNLRVHGAGIQAFHSESFTVSYYPRKSRFALFRQLFRYGFGRARVARKHPGSLSLLALLASLLCVCLLLAPAIMLWKPVFGGLMALGVVLYLVTTAIVAAVQANRDGLGIWWKTFTCFPFIHLGAGFGYLSGLFSGPDLSHAPGRRIPQPDTNKSPQ